jgi:hypothetical protein
VTPFMQFRIWFRKASAGQRAAGAGGVVLLIALLIWSAVPSSNGSSALIAVGGPSGATAATAGSGSGRSGTLSGGTTVGGSLGASGGTGSSPDTSASAISGGDTAAAGTLAAPSGSGPSGSTSPGSAPGTSGTSSGTTAPETCSKMGQLKIGVALAEGAGGALNQLIGAPPVAQEQADFAAVFDSVNQAGGVDCYDLEGDYAADDQTNPSSAQAACLQFAQDKTFAVLGGFLPTSTDDCLLQNHLPTFDQLSIPGGAVKQFYPYYYSPDPTYEVLDKNFVGAVNQMGYFTSAKHFAKLGIFYRDCIPSVNQALLADLAAVGVSGSKVDRFDLGCDSEFASPLAIQQGIVQFKTDGVTTLTVDNDLEDIQNLSNTAANQGFKPAGGWILADDGVAAITASASFHPNASEFNGAVAITPLQYGANTSNLPETAGTQACDKVMTSHHLPAVYQSADQFAGSTCSLIWMLVAAMDHGGPTPAGLVAGLQAAKSVQMSFPNGPNDFSAPGTTTGGQFWRPISYRGSCGCWFVTNPTWSPSFS